MKNKIVLIVAAALVVIFALGAVVSAADVHTAMQGNKLIGYGGVGTLTNSVTGVKTTTSSFFECTNTDDVNDIKIKRLSIIKADGTLIYEGPYVVPSGPPSAPNPRIIIDSLGPHQTLALVLSSYIYKGPWPVTPESAQDPANWKTVQENVDGPPTSYTVEINWESLSKAPVSPLVGWQRTYQREFNSANVQTALAIPYTNMVNVVQPAVR